jgi:protein TonB
VASVQAAARAPLAPAPAPAAVSTAAPATSEAPAFVAAAPAAPTFVMTLPVTSQGGSAAPKAVPERRGDEIVDERRVSSRAKVAYGPVPAYPREARAAEIETDVPVEIVVDPNGAVVDARLERTVGYGIDEATLRAIRKYRFTPALKDGRAVAVRMQWTMKYRLE